MFTYGHLSDLGCKVTDILRDTQVFCLFFSIWQLIFHSFVTFFAILSHSFAYLPKKSYLCGMISH